YVRSVRAALVNQGITAVAGIGASPSTRGIHQLRAVVLRAADHEVGVRGMKRKALELGGAERAVVQAGPGVTAVSGFENATVISGVDDVRISRRDGNYMAVRMQTGIRTIEGRAIRCFCQGSGPTGKGCSRCGIPVAADINHFCILRIESYRRIINALPSAKASSTKDRRPGHAIERCPQGARLGRAGRGRAGAAVRGSESERCGCTHAVYRELSNNGRAGGPE